MARFAAQRLLRLVGVLLTITVASFFFMHVIPGDPITVRLGEHATPQAVSQLTAQLGLDHPWYVQLLRYLGSAAHGDLGASIFDQQPVTGKLLQYFPATIELGLAAMLVAILVGVPAGVAAAVRRGTALDAAIMTLVLVGVSIPVFWLGWMLVYLFGVVPDRWHLDLFPISGRLALQYTVSPITHLVILDALLEGNWGAAADGLWHLALPAVTLGTIPLAIIAKMTRSGMLEVLGSDYIRTARAKGLGERAVVLRHGLRNALIPILTVVGLQTGLLLGGAVLTESIFAWPGVGRLAFEAISNRDFPVVNGCILLFAVTFVVVNTIVDLLYAAANPRIRYG